MHPRDDLIRRSLPMVRDFATRFRRTPMGYDEALSCGNLALVESAERWDESRGVPFAGFASRRVHGAMQDARRGHRVLGSPVTCVPDEELEWLCGHEVIDVGAIDLRDAVRALRPRLRAALLLFAAGYSQVEIADGMGVSGSRVCQLIGEARSRVRRDCLSSPRTRCLFQQGPLLPSSWGPFTPQGGPVAE